MNYLANRTMRLLQVPLLATMTACASHPLSSNTLPGNPVLSFPNSVDRAWVTVIASNPYTHIAGVSGRTLIVTTYHHNKATADQLTLDNDGNLGLRGSLSSTSTRSMKKEVAPYRSDALALLRDINVVTYRYTFDSLGSPRRIGFIAEDTPSDLSGAKHDSINLNNTIGVEMAAIKQLDSEIHGLRSEVHRLRAEMTTRKQQAGRNGSLVAPPRVTPSH